MVMMVALCLQELLGHALALYHANRQNIVQLEAHLSQYGYCAPAGLTVEPADPTSASTSYGGEEHGSAMQRL